MNLKNKLLALSAMTMISISFSSQARFDINNETIDTTRNLQALRSSIDSETQFGGLQPIIGTGFEAGEGYSLGFLANGAVGSITWAQLCNIEVDPAAVCSTIPVISDANPSSGSQHLRLDVDPNFGQAGQGANVNIGKAALLPASPNLTDKNSVSFDVSVSLSGGADYFIEGDSSTEGSLSWIFRVSFQNNTLVVDDTGGGLAYVDIGLAWVENQTYTVRIETDPNDGPNGSIRYYRDDVLVYTGVAGLFAGQVADTIIFYDDNWQSPGEFGDFDNFSFNPNVVSDLSLTKSNDAAGTVALNDSVEYTLTVENIGTTVQTNVVLTDTMPAGMTYVSSSCDDTTSGSFSAPDLTLNLQDISPGATTVCTVVATVGDYGTHVNNATVSSDADDDLVNNDATSSVTGPNEVDLSIAKTSDAGGQLATNDPLIYTLTVTNNDGTDTANNVVVTDVLPPQVSYVSNDCGAVEAGGTVTWSQATLAAGANAICNISTTVIGFGTFDNTADVTGDEDDSNLVNNTSTVSVDGPIAVAGVDLQIIKTSDAGAPLAANDPVVYTLAISNLDGTNTANNVVVTDVLPSGVAYVSNTCGAAQVGGTVTWNAGNLGPGGNTSCNISATMVGFGFINNTATVSSDEADNNSTNNTSTTTIEGPEAVDLTLVKTANAPDPLFLGTTISYTLTAQNVNTGDATGVVVSDALPTQVSYLSNTCGASVAGGVLTWNIGSMTSGSVETCNINVTVDAEGTINNTASISSNETDVAGNNNSSTAGVFVGTPVIIPALNWLGMLLLILTMGLFGRRLAK